jgi:hypothetical protein
MVGGLVPAQTLLQVVDSRQELACEHCARIAQAEVAPQPGGAGQARSGVTWEEERPPCSTGRLDQAKPEQRTGDLGVEARLVGEDVELDEVRRPLRAPDEL